MSADPRHDAEWARRTEDDAIPALRTATPTPRSGLHWFLFDVTNRAIAEAVLAAFDHPHPRGQVRLEYLRQQFVQVTQDQTAAELEYVNLLEMARRLRVQYLTGAWDLH
ncbi:hypothetical protein [Deinococcus sonorensis]|uniref:Uncharacterized protein n=2 Tax=Deinococcus sonorensis TaxID=309891 RepID=A0AAU7U664_9DEIO